MYPPPWYEYIDWPTWGRILQLSPDAKIIKEALGLFARWMITTQEGLKEFLNQRWLKTRRWNKIYLSFAQRLLERDRLLFYAGYINYPDWEVNMIPAKHPSIIDLSLVSKISERLHPITFYNKSSKSDIWKRLPLRGFLIDSESNIYYSWWPSQGKNKLYFYYSCRLKDENGKIKTINIMHNILHTEFVSYLDTFKIDEDTLWLFEMVMMNVWKEKGNIKSDLLKDKTKRINGIDKEINAFMDKIQGTTKEQMIELYENKIITLTEEKENLQFKIKETSSEQDIDIDKLISNTKAILINPKFIRDLQNIELQRMLIGILFNSKIYYNKKTGFQTPEIPLIYAHLRSIDLTNTHLVEIAFNLLHPLEQELAKNQFLIVTLYDSLKVSEEKMNMDSY